ncbi:hypothetical protein CCUS01_00700, partial [Colletotrichum cuscutae]
YLKLIFKIIERGFKIAIPCSFYYLLGRRYKILKSKSRYYKYIRRGRSYNIITNTIYNYKFSPFFINIFLY